AMNMAPFIFWNLAFYTIIRTQLCFAGNVLPCPAFFDLSIQSEVFLTFAILCSGCTIEVSQGASDKKDLMGVEGAFCMRLLYRAKATYCKRFYAAFGERQRG
ncbi:hypothetical protein ABND43_17725, partial [Paenibacillus larvae]